MNEITNERETVFSAIEKLLQPADDKLWKEIKEEFTDHDYHVATMPSALGSDAPQSTPSLLRQII